MVNRAKSWLIAYRRLIIIITHFVLVCLAYILSFLLRFDFSIPAPFFQVFLKTLPLLILIKLAVFYYFGLFQGLWRYVSINDLWQIIKASVVSTIIFVIGNVFIYGLMNFPRSVFLEDFIICTFLVGGIRFLTRMLRERYRSPKSVNKRVKVLIVGAGEAGILTLKEYKNTPSMGEVVGFIDDDKAKRHRSIAGVKILGDRTDIPAIVENFAIEEIVLAIPSAKGQVIRDLIVGCQMPRVKLKIVPGLTKIISGELELKPREVKPEDLLGREVVRIKETEIKSYLKGKRILVTGAAGSIGSELCRQISGFASQELILFDHNENDLYFLEVEFKTKYPHIRFQTVVGDAGDVGLLKHVFSSYKPQVIFHSAAYKHVPLMEENPAAAVQNNVIVSRNLIYACHHYKAERFVLISTDKAVNPTSVMGATKRLAEMVLQAKAKNSATNFIAVRFGNVIGSAGSVVPLFKKQIEQGGPVTITDPESKRYFMSVSEATQLVLQAVAIGKGGEIFILDMGEQIKIADLARDLIILSGLHPDKDIEIKYVGLRPGEKLSEETLIDSEKDKATKYDKIYITQPNDFDIRKVRRQIKELERISETRDSHTIIAKLREIVPAYVPHGRHLPHTR